MAVTLRYARRELLLSRIVQPGIGRLIRAAPYLHHHVGKAVSGVVKVRHFDDLTRISERPTLAALLCWAIN